MPVEDETKCHGSVISIRYRGVESKLSIPSMPIKVLIVEDERAIQELIAYTCRTSGFEVERTATVGEARRKIENHVPDIILLDWMLPDCSGLEWLNELRHREETKTIPVIMLTARGQEDDKVLGLEIGADDYMVKPFSPRELIARIRVAIRHRAGGTEAEEKIVCGSLCIDPTKFEIKVEEQALKVSVTEFRMLTLLAQHPGRVYSRQQIIDKVWGYGVCIDERTVDVHMLRLRKQLARTVAKDFIETVHGIGYRAREMAR